MATGEMLSDREKLERFLALEHKIDALTVKLDETVSAIEKNNLHERILNLEGRQDFWCDFWAKVYKTVAVVSSLLVLAMYFGWI